MNSLTGAWHMAGGARASSSFLPQDAIAFLVSLITHLVVMVAFGLIPLPNPLRQPFVIDARPPEPADEFELPQQFLPTDFPAEAIGANSMDGVDALLAVAPEVSEVSELTNPVDYLESEIGEIQLTRTLELTTGLRYKANLAIKGAAGEGVQGAEGAIDRITQEIMNSLEERKTLVVWLLDQSPSLAKQHERIHDRLDRIYTELGLMEAAGNPAFTKHASKPLLTNVYWFGEKVQPALKGCTDNLEEIKKAISNVPIDPSGVEHVFSAIFVAAREAEADRGSHGRSGEPDRNVLIIVFTDEAGEDQDGLEATVKYCRQHAMSVYVVGAPAPFGRKETYFKFVDPNPAYDQSERWDVVDQGPETLLPERLKLAFDETPEDERPIDSGFGPYALTRLCYETGGIYFAVHPNRDPKRTVSRRETDVYAAHIERFFDPDVMRRYRPDYLPPDEYERRVKSNAARTALVTAAQLAWVTMTESPRVRFMKVDDGQFINELSEAQKSAALLEPQLQQIYDILKGGEKSRDQEASPRWQAGYDLAMGRLLSVKVRTEAYNALLAKAKRGMTFANARNNTWVMEPDNEWSSLGSQFEKQAERARFYLERVRDQHAGTPWSYLAEKELASPMGWKWTETLVDLTPPRRPAATSAAATSPATPAPSAGIPARPVEPRKPTREFKKL